MRYFVCLLHPTGDRVSEAGLSRYELLPRSRGLDFTRDCFGNVAVLTAWDDWFGDPVVARDGENLAVGFVRLDNRPELERWTDAVGLGLSELQLVLRLIARSGTRRIRDILGDFGFVVWNRSTRYLVTATDAFSVRKIFYSQGSGVLAFASRAESLSLDEKYEVQYLAERVACCTPTEGLTAYAGVHALPPASYGVLQDGKLRLTKYWTPEDFEPAPLQGVQVQVAPEMLRGLLVEAVNTRLSPDGNTWAHLSGGVDSSSIVSVAQWMVEQGDATRGLAGTITYVDWQNTEADEREYAQTVATRWRVRNETILDPPMWLEDGIPCPRLDQPVGLMAFYPRDYRQQSIMRSCGARVLLAGVGSDELFTGNTIFFADRVVRGHLIDSVREMINWAVTGRVSFWSLAMGNAILPLVPKGLRRPSSMTAGRLLPWVAPSAASRFGLRTRTQALTRNGGRLGHKYQGALIAALNDAVAELEATSVGDAIEVRYPFLHRPLVEFALQLPPDLCTRPYARKWVLREAMRGIVPEVVRTRIDKGASTDVLIDSLVTRRSLLEPLVRNPLLAEMGVVDAALLRNAFERAPFEGNGDSNLAVDVQATLTLEAWLQVRSGRWPQEM